MGITPLPNLSPVATGEGLSDRAPVATGEGLRTSTLPLVVLGALAILHLWPVAGPNRLPQNLDLMLQYVPNAAHLARGLAHLTIPLWNPWQGGGLPFAANPGTGAWYPPSWLLLSALPLWDAVRASLWLHLAIAIAGTWRCLRGPMRATAHGALVGTLAFALSPWLPGLTGMPVVLTSLAWMPWVIDAGLRLGRGPRVAPRTITILAVVTAAQVASGWPAGAYLSWLVLGAATVLRAGQTITAPALEEPREARTAEDGPIPPSPPSLRGEGGTSNPSGAHDARVRGGRRLLWVGRVRALAAVLPAGLLAAAIAGVVLIPAAEFISRTTYAGTRPVERVANDGYLTLLSWLRPAAGVGALEGGQVSVGVAALVLAAISPVLLRQDPAGRAALRSWGAIAATSIVLSWGTRTPLFGLLYEWLPGFRILYLPARLGIVASFAIACLAAAVVDWFASPSPRPLERSPLPNPSPAAAGEGLPDPTPAPLRRERGESASAATLVTAIGASLPPLILAQFWHSEGYDNFRRLLTNLWRVTGGPFLSVPQELHAIGFGLATLAIVVVALRAPTARRRALATALTATAVADLSVLAVMSTGPSFDPARWYAPAYAAAPAIRDAIGHDRFASLPWHAGDPDASRVRHFLGDFPTSARPAMLPPNLGLLVGVRDAQAYDPLILRATARAFAAGGAPDDHWAWLAAYDPAITRPLAVREVLADPRASWRVPARTLGAAVARCCDPVVAWDGAGAPVDWSRLHLVGFLGEGIDVAQGTTVGEVALTTGSLTSVVPLRAGIEVSEWAYDRPDVRQRIGHAQAPISLVTRVVGAVGGRYDTFEYRTTVLNDAQVPLDGVTVRAIVPGVTLHVVHLAVDPGSSPWQPSALGWTDTGAGASRLRLDPPGAGTATWIRDDPEHLRIAASVTQPAQVVIADTAYPGWVATLDGAPLPVIEPVGVLARLVEVPPGEHIVDLTFEPLSVRIGGVASLVGLAVASGLLVLRRVVPPAPAAVRHGEEREKGA